MATPAPTEHFEPQRRHLESALKTRLGIRLKFEDIHSARNFRMRCYTLRKLERHNNRMIYPATDPLHNSCAYDSLVLTVQQTKDGIFVLIHNSQPEPSHVSEI